MIMVTGLVFVLTVIVLQLASTQFSPRLLRSFLRDRGTQLVLATFVSSFAYSLAGLHTVGGVGSDGEVFVPRLAVSGAMALSLISLGMLVYYIQHITDSIRIESIISRVTAATLDSLRRIHPSRTDVAETLAAKPTPPASAIVVAARSSGYIQGYVDPALLSVAVEHDVVINLIHPIGHHIVESRPVAYAWNPDPGALPVGVEHLADDIRAAILMAPERYEDRDVGFGIRQLVDIAVRSVSPSVNDPYTSVMTIQPLSALMVEMAHRDLSDHMLHDTQGNLRVTEPVTSFADHLSLICGEIRRVASNRPRVVTATLRLLEDVSGHCTDDAQRASVREQIGLLIEDVEQEVSQKADLADAHEVAITALAALDARSFPTHLLELMATTAEASIETYADGHGHRTVIWLSVHDGHAYVRSFNGATARWYERTLSAPRITLILGETRIRAEAIPAADAESIQSATAGFVAKYPPSESLDGMIDANVLDTTLRLEATN